MPVEAEGEEGPLLRSYGRQAISALGDEAAKAARHSPNGEGGLANWSADYFLAVPPRQFSGLQRAAFEALRPPLGEHVPTGQ